MTVTKYVICDKEACEYLSTVYSDSTTWNKKVNCALECTNPQEAKCLRDLALRRCTRATGDVVIRMIETTVSEFDPDAPHTK